MATTREIAIEIDLHLKRMQADPNINTMMPRNNVYPKFHGARAYADGGWVKIMYVSFQGWNALRKKDAEKYLGWLNAGHVGKHYGVVGDSHA